MFEPFDRYTAIMRIWLMEQRLEIMNHCVDKRFHLNEYRKYQRRFFNNRKKKLLPIS